MEAGRIITCAPGRAARPHPAQSRDERPGGRHPFAVRRLAAHPAGRGSRRRTATRNRRCASSSRAMARSPRSTANGPSCSRAISSSRRPGPGTTTAMTATDRWSGSTGSTSRSLPCSTPAFAEPGNAEQQMATKPTGDSLARYGSGLLPVDWKPTVKNSPIFNYPYARTREALEQLTPPRRDIDPCHGIKLRYVNPASGDYAMPTMASFMQLLPKGFSSQPYRSTDSTVYNRRRGRGRDAGRRHGFSPGSRATSSSYRAGCRTPHHPQGRSGAVQLFPIVRCTRNSASGARSASLTERAIALTGSTAPLGSTPVEAR